MKDTDELWSRIKRLLPRSQDISLVLLKGHLLIEEQLFAYIAAHCCSPAKLEDARLTFVQKLRVAESISGGLGDIAHSLKKLNAIRNKMAHHPEVLDLADKLDDYLQTWAGDEFVRPKTARERTRHLRNALIYQIALIAGMSEGVNYVKHSVSHTRSS